LDELQVSMFQTILFVMVVIWRQHSFFKVCCN